MIGKTLGHYRTGEPLGRGGMGEVYAADDLNLSRKVALKFLPEAFAGDPERMARFEREAKLLASLNHPNIAAIYGLEQAEGKRFIVMELVEGETLAQRIGKGALPADEAVALCRQIAEGLEAAHEKGVIHRDLKPANVMITEGDKVKILDFGLAKALSDEAQSVDSSQSPTLTEAMTRPGVILGTAAYMSPEQAKAKSADRRTDIWAFGCILYECLTGKRAFEGETVTETLAAVLTKEPEWQSVDANLRPLLHRCLERDPRKRLRDIGDAFALLESTPESAPVKRPWLAWSIAALFFVALASVSFVHFREKPPATAEAMKFHILLHEKVSLDWGSSFAVSPDGRRLAFAAAGADGVVRLWIRALGSLEARPLDGTESGHIAPFFWSPDSRSIAWGTEGKLKRIDIAGGLAKTICDIPDFAMGGSWNRDGVIIFGVYQQGPLQRVPAAGGVASPLTRLDPSRHVTAQYFPIFLPDGRHFLYWQDSTIPENRGVYIGSLDSKPEQQDSRKLLSAAFWPCVYVPSRDSGRGRILFLNDQTLLAQEFDDKQPETVGDAVPVAAGVGSYAGGSQFSASTNGTLIYESGEAAIKRDLVWMDRSGNQLEPAASAAEYTHFRLSPDEKSVVFSRVVDNNCDIWVLDLRRNVSSKLTHDPAVDDSPIWSPDGSRIAWSSHRSGESSVYSIAATGAGQEELLTKTGKPGAYVTDWSQERKAVLYYRPGERDSTDLWIAPQYGDKKPFPYFQSQFNKYHAMFSPDGRWIAYVSDESGRNEVYVQDFPLTNERKRQISSGGGADPQWRKDGTELFYLAADRKLMAVPVRMGATTFEPGMPKALFSIPGTSVSRTYAPTRDGQRFLVARSPGGDTASFFTVILNWQAGLK